MLITNGKAEFQLHSMMSAGYTSAVREIVGRCLEKGCSFRVDVPTPETGHITATVFVDMQDFTEFMEVATGRPPKQNQNQQPRLSFSFSGLEPGAKLRMESTCNLHLINCFYATFSGQARLVDEDGNVVKDWGEVQSITVPRLTVAATARQEKKARKPAPWYRKHSGEY